MSNEKICPVCGELNNCAIAGNDSKTRSNGQNNQTCWCFQKVGTLNRQKLTEISVGDEKSCLCQKCWDKFSKQK